MTPKRLAILGVGLLGGSLGLAAKSSINGCRVVGYGHRPASLEAAIQRGAIDQAEDNPGDAVRGADLVVLCTPVGIFKELLQAIVPVLSPGCLVTDVGSTKRSVVDIAKQILPPQVHFVGSHPMAGSEKRGVEFARADLFRNAVCFLTPTAQTDASALASIESFWHRLGMQTQRLTPTDHDRYLADISHLPHVAAAALVSMQSDVALSLAGKGFLDATRIAAGDGGLWRDIVLDNRDNLIAGLQRLKQELETVEKILKNSDASALRQWLDDAARRRTTCK